MNAVFLDTQRTCGNTPMISTVEQYHQAQEELRQLEERLHRLQQSHPLGRERVHQGGDPEDDRTVA